GGSTTATPHDTLRARFDAGNCAGAPYAAHRTAVSPARRAAISSSTDRSAFPSSRRRAGTTMNKHASSSDFTDDRVPARSVLNEIAAASDAFNAGLHAEVDPYLLLIKLGRQAAFDGPAVRARFLMSFYRDFVRLTAKFPRADVDALARAGSRVF